MPCLTSDQAFGFLSRSFGGAGNVRLSLFSDQNFLNSLVMLCVASSLNL